MQDVLSATCECSYSTGMEEADTKMPRLGRKGAIGMQICQKCDHAYIFSFKTLMQSLKELISRMI